MSETQDKFNIETYWTSPPPEPSQRCDIWVAKIKAGWRPNRRIRQMGYYEGAEFYGVYIWEYSNVIQPLIRELTEAKEAKQPPALRLNTEMPVRCAHDIPQSAHCRECCEEACAKAMSRNA